MTYWDDVRCGRIPGPDGQLYSDVTIIANAPLELWTRGEDMTDAAWTAMTKMQRERDALRERCAMLEQALQAREGPAVIGLALAACSGAFVGALVTWALLAL